MLAIEYHISPSAEVGQPAAEDTSNGLQQQLSYPLLLCCISPITKKYNFLDPTNIFVPKALSKRNMPNLIQKPPTSVFEQLPFKLSNWRSSRFLK